jgi:mono/diheme cytochrome c family protein
MSKQTILFPVAALTAVLAIGVTAIAAGRTTKDGVFTAEQAERGKLVYDKSCKNCHQPEFYSERLLRYANQPVSALYDTVSGTMPADNVGSLLTSEYVDVLAYVFSITGSSPGKTELSTDTMQGINIAKPE